jgi:metal-responsive CopG/Arc/MetJ family transcriptional regulator
MILYMKAIQVTLDEALLARLDQDDEVQRDGRSAVLRRAADLYLRQRHAREVAAAYRRAYGDRPGLGAEFEGWEREGAWPAE